MYMVLYRKIMSMLCKNQITILIVFFWVVLVVKISTDKTFLHIFQFNGRKDFNTKKNNTKFY